MVKLCRKKFKNDAKETNEHISNLLLLFNVPGSYEDSDFYKSATLSHICDIEKFRMQNKIKNKTRPLYALKKLIKSVNIGEHEQTNGGKSNNPNVLTKFAINNEGSDDSKVLFSKLDFSSHLRTKIRKSHLNIREILENIKQTENKLKNLKKMGKLKDANKIKNDISWKKAFDKVKGNKVKDNPKFICKAIKKRNKEKITLKRKWKDRNRKAECVIQQQQKKRQENIIKRISNKNKSRMKKLSKKGVIIL